MQRLFRIEIREHQDKVKERQKECVEVNKRQKLYRQLVSKLGETDSVGKII